MRKITAPSINDKVTPCFGYNFLIWGCLTTKETISDTRASVSWWHRGQETSPQVKHSPEGVRDGDDQLGFGHTRAAKGTIPLLVTGSKEKTPWETVPWRTWKRDLGNYSLTWCLSAKQQNYSPPAHSSSNGLFFFFPSSAEFRRSQPAHEPCWCKREKAQAESNGVHPSMQMPLL